MTFQLKSDKKETENKTIRFPLPLSDKINTAIVNQDVSFSGFVIQACEYALDNMPPASKTAKGK
jgi:hypothetical protein